MRQEEHEEQVKVIEWWKSECSSFGIPEPLLFAIPNGGLRNLIVAKRMKAEGVRPGVPDLLLSVPRGHSHALYIEMKKLKGGRVSPDQKEFHKLLAFYGYAVFVAKGFEEAKDIITRYINAEF